jgi:hypothetical protein
MQPVSSIVPAQTGGTDQKSDGEQFETTTYAQLPFADVNSSVIARRPCKLGSHTPCITNSVGSKVGTIYNGYPSDKWIESALSALNKDLQDVNSIVDPVYVDSNRTAVIKTSDDGQRDYLEVKNNPVAGVKVDTFRYKIPLEYNQNADAYGRKYAN